MNKQIYAKKDEIVTCENGLLVFKFKEDMLYGDHLAEQFFIFFDDQKKPIKGTLLNQCLCHCGAHYAGDDWGIFHFENGWRREP